MKPISKKVIEAGLIPKHTLLLFKRWGFLDPKDDILPDTQTALTSAENLKQGFIRFVEELDELLEEKAEEEPKETRFSITLKEPFAVEWLREDKHGCWVEYSAPYDETLVVFKDEADRLIFPPSHDPNGRHFRIKKSKIHYEVIESTPLWYGSTLYAYQVEAEPFNTRSDRATL